ncbi:hypothetical protein GQX74_009014 [Glossina fuscipes]|nr:hypothetical protein GQX74_009014 [Glossina fuscipes]
MQRLASQLIASINQIAAAAFSDQGNEKWELRIGYPLNQPVEKVGLDKKQYSDTIGKGFLIISLYEAHRIISCQGDARRASALLSKMLEVKATLFKAIAITNASSGEGHSLTCI